MRTIEQINTLNIMEDGSIEFGLIILCITIFVLLFFFIGALYQKIANIEEDSIGNSFDISTRALLITTPIYIVITTLTFMYVVTAWIIWLTIILTWLVLTLLGLLIINRIINNTYDSFKKNVINSVLWPITIVLWSTFKFIFVTPFVIIRNRIVFPIYNWLVFPVMKITNQKPTGEKLLNEIEKNAIYQVKELDNTINQIQAMNYTKDAIDVHFKTISQVSAASKAIDLLSEEGIYIPYKYKTNPHVFSEDQNIVLNENDVKGGKTKETKYSNAYLAFKTKMLLWRNIGVSTRMTVFSESLIFNLLWLASAFLSIGIIALFATSLIVITPANFMLATFVIGTWFAIENYLNKNVKLKANDRNVSKLNERVARYIVSLELFEDRLNGFILRDREEVVRVANQEYRKEFWYYIVKFGASIFKEEHNKNYLSSEAASEVFVEDEVNEQLLKPYSYEEVVKVYPTISNVQYKKSTEQILRNDLLMRPSLVIEDPRELSREYDVSFTYVNKLVQESKESVEFKEIQNKEINEIRDAIYEKPMLAFESFETLANKFDISIKVIETIIEDLFFENKFLKTIKEIILKKHKDLLNDPLNVRFDSTPEQINVISRRHGIEPKVLGKFINSLKADNNIVKAQSDAINKLREELEFFVWMNTNHREIFDDASFMMKYTNALKSDIDYVRKKIVNQEDTQFFANLYRNENKKRFELMDASFKHFTTLKLRNKELRKGDM